MPAASPRLFIPSYQAIVDGRGPSVTVVPWSRVQSKSLHAAAVAATPVSESTSVIMYQPATVISLTGKVVI